MKSSAGNNAYPSLHNLVQELKKARQIHESYYLQSNLEKHSSIQDLIAAEVIASEAIWMALRNLLHKLDKKVATSSDMKKFKDILDVNLENINKLTTHDEYRVFSSKYKSLNSEIEHIANVINIIENASLKITNHHLRKRLNFERSKAAQASANFGTETLKNPSLSTPQLNAEINELYKLWRKDKKEFQKNLLLLGPKKQEILDKILHDAIKISDREIVREAIDLGAKIRNISAIDRLGIVEDTLALCLLYPDPLTESQSEIVKLLIKAGANLNQTLQLPHEKKASLLEVAARMNCHGFVDILIAAGVNLDHVAHPTHLKQKSFAAGHLLQQAFAMTSQFANRSPDERDEEREMQSIYFELKQSYKFNENIFVERIMMIASGTIKNPFDNEAWHLLLSCLIFYGPDVPVSMLLTIGQSLLLDNNPFGRIFLTKAQVDTAGDERLNPYLADILKYHNYKLLADQDIKEIILDHVEPQLIKDIHLYDWILADIFRSKDALYLSQPEKLYTLIPKTFEATSTQIYYALGRVLEDIAFITDTDAADTVRQLRVASFCYKNASGYRDADKRFWDCMEGDKTHSKEMNRQRSGYLSAHKPQGSWHAPVLPYKKSSPK